MCVVFFPVVLLEGPARFLFTPLALGVVISMMASYLLSRTLVPTLARILMEKEALHPEGESIGARFNRARDRASARFQEAYARSLGAVLHHRALVLICGSLVLACTAFLPFVVGLDFFPAVDAGQMRLHYRAPIGTRLEETERQVARLEQRIQDIVPAGELETINSMIGMPISYNHAFVQTDNTGSQDADVLIALKPKHAPTESYMERIRRELPDQFAGSTLYFQAADIVSQVLNFGLSAPIDVQIDGPDVEASYAVARELLAKIRAIPGASDVRIPQVLAYPTLRVDVDRARAAQVGISQRDVANNLLVSLASSSLVAPSFWINPKNNVNYPVVVQTPLRQIDSIPSLLGMPLGRGTALISSTAPAPMPASPPAPGEPPGSGSYLGAVATLRPTTGLSMINHVSVQRVVDVQASATGRDLGGVTLDIEKAIRSIRDLPKATRITVRGQSESMFAAFGRLGVGLILAIALVYLLLVVLFQSFLDPFIILVAVPGALIGILWMLAATGTTLNVESFMGAIMAVGIATSNSILLVNSANDARVTQGLGVLEAAIEAGKTRLRPVLMTALAMILGMVPMAVALGEGGEQNAPLGRAVIGGLIVATFVTLFVVPAVYTPLPPVPARAPQPDATSAAVDTGRDRVKEGQQVAVLESPDLEAQVAAAAAEVTLRRQQLQRALRLAGKSISENEREQAEEAVKVAQSALDRARVQKGYDTLRAPFDGTVVARYADPGALLPAATGSTSSAQPLLEIAQLDRLRVALQLGQDDAARVRTRGSVSLPIDPGKPPFGARVPRLAPSLDPPTRP